MNSAYGSMLRRMRAGQHHGEDERVDQQQQQRVDERPEEPEHRPAVARLQVARDEGLDRARDSGAGWRGCGTSRGRGLAVTLSVVRARSCDLQPHEAPRIMRDPRALEVDRRIAGSAQLLLGVAPCRPRPAPRRCPRPLGDLRQHRHPVGQHLGEARTRSTRKCFSAPLRYHSSPGCERGEQRRVPGQHAEVALRRRAAAPRRPRS